MGVVWGDWEFIIRISISFANACLTKIDELGQEVLFPARHSSQPAIGLLDYC
jgi:hypothetical protein